MSAAGPASNSILLSIGSARARFASRFARPSPRPTTARPVRSPTGTRQCRRSTRASISRARLLLAQSEHLAATASVARIGRGPGVSIDRSQTPASYRERESRQRLPLYDRFSSRAQASGATPRLSQHAAEALSRWVDRDDAPRRTGMCSDRRPQRVRRDLHVALRHRQLWHMRCALDGLGRDAWDQLHELVDDAREHRRALGALREPQRYLQVR